MTEPPATRDSSLAPPLSGILETALYVDDLERAERFYTRLFATRTLVREPGRLHAVSIAERQVLLLFRKRASDAPNPVPGGVVPPHDGGGRLHVAFAIPVASLGAWEARLAEHGIEVEARVRPPLGGTSLYFRDPDGHLVELATPGLWEVY
jgi:catechol 2,3-dioxygenase-like lactoylglutathione lyase family enzyme